MLFPYIIKASYLVFPASRVRWILPLLIGLMLICLAILGAYLVQGHVVLLYPSDDDRHLPGMLCHLGSSLQALGFTVSLDLWSQAELSALGPVPWLHSRLDQLQRQGGKVVLVLTKATWTRAEESYPPSSRRVDVFGASLSCILADYLQGRAGERLMLVQFESLPPEGFRPFPCLFCGLHVYSLPSQSLGFLTELAGTKHIASASARRKRAGRLRKAS
uniref:SEFIR domain-containing protein n=1 Tax=Nothobranchius furzeri TaxID=105023 RepID=A0A8C6Q684_NOTFU